MYCNVRYTVGIIPKFQRRTLEVRRRSGEAAVGQMFDADDRLVADGGLSKLC